MWFSCSVKIEWRESKNQEKIFSNIKIHRNTTKYWRTRDLDFEKLDANNWIQRKNEIKFGNCYFEKTVNSNLIANGCSSSHYISTKNLK